MILITGGNGQLGQHLAPLLGPQGTVLSSAELDITDPAAITSALDGIRPSAVINCAAYTNVDLAESEPERAHLINSEAVALLARETQKRGIKLVHVSTDYVFSGQSSPINEGATPHPLNEYGRSKLAGEHELLANTNLGIIVRTGWLYSTVGKNFLNSMLRLGAEREDLGVVYDQVGTPTYAGDLARALVTVIKEHDFAKSDIFHFSNEGLASWYDFAHEIFQLWSLKIDLRPILSSEYPTKAKRPAYSVLDKTKIKSVLQVEISHWKDSLARLSSGISIRS